MLSNSDNKFWGPNPEITSYLLSKIGEKDRVLEIGPGQTPFPRAEVFIDIDDTRGPKKIVLDLADAKIPFPDKSFDFVYCRHVLEDMHNPFLLCREMSRVGKAGYIETPSPLAEMCRGIDANSPRWRGYCHHLFVIWSEDEELRFVSKFPMIEVLQADDEAIAAALRGRPNYWNTHLLWKGDLKVRHMRAIPDFGMPHGYSSVLSRAVDASVKSTDKFYRMLSN